MSKRHPVLYLAGLAFAGLLTTTSVCQNPIFKAPKIYPSGGAYTDGVAVADLNGDGKLDVVVVDRGGSVCCSNGYVGVLLGNGDGTFAAPVTYPTGIAPVALLVTSTRL